MTVLSDPGRRNERRCALATSPTSVPSLPSTAGGERLSAAEAATAARNANRRGILCMCGAMATFVVNDALVKVVSDSLATSQLIFIRGLMATTLVLVVARMAGVLKHWRVLTRPLVIGRASLDAIATVLYLVALFHMPIGNATAVNLISPVMMTLAAALFLGERVGRARWLAVIGGFLGVLLVIQPTSSGFNYYALVCLAGTVFHAARDLLTRRLPSDAPSLIVTLATAIVVTLATGLLSVVEGWRPIAGRDLLLLACAAVFLSAGYQLIIMSMRSGDLSLVGPFRYTALLFALVLGWLIWGDWPNALAWIGIAMLLASGLQVLRAERLRRAAAVRAVDAG